MKAKYAYSLFLLLFSAIVLSCGSRNSTFYFSDPEKRLPEISELNYFTPVVYLESKELASSYTPRGYVQNTKEVLDSVFMADPNFRIAGKIGNAEQNLPLVSELGELFQQFRSGEADWAIPSLIKDELQKRPERYSIAIYLEPEFTHYSRVQPPPVVKAPDLLVRQRSRTSLLLFDKESDSIIFFGSSSHPGRDYFPDLIDLRRIYKKMLPSFEK